MDSVMTTVGLPAALAIIMFGLGLSLTVADFARVAKQPKAVAIALAAQLLLLPAICFGLVLLFDLPPVLAVGMMLLAASPGGTTANLFSHLFRGDIALNITLTATNSVLSVVTLPIVVNLAFAYFDPQVGDGEVGLQLGKTAQVFLTVLVPVVLGMLVRRLAPALADRSAKPFRIMSAVVLAVVIVGALLSDRENLPGYIADVGVIVTVFCLLSLSIGYLLPRLLNIGHPQAVASSFEVGVHNSVLAIAIGSSVLGEDQLAVPGAMYGVVMFPLAALAGWLLSRRRPADAAGTPVTSADAASPDGADPAGPAVDADRSR